MEGQRQRERNVKERKQKGGGKREEVNGGKCKDRILERGGIKKEVCIFLGENKRVGYSEISGDMSQEEWEKVKKRAP